MKVRPGNRIEELADFLEWIANATPEDEKAIRAEIKRYYYDVGDIFGGEALNRALSDILEPGMTKQARQEVLNGIEEYANVDPAEMGQLRSSFAGAILSAGLPETPEALEELRQRVLALRLPTCPREFGSGDGRGAARILTSYCVTEVCLPAFQ